jgi:proteasome lid subunit RPN8/RPN11
VAKVGKVVRTSCSSAIVSETLAALQDAGRLGKELVVFWLAKRGQVVSTDLQTDVIETYVPIQESERDYFRISSDSMRQLMRHLRARRLALVGQVHSHPHKAFHSRADDQWAVPRHENALSIVIPDFAQHTTEDTFLEKAAIFRLRGDDKWVQVPFDDPIDGVTLGS